jgi:FlaA1/EpsC-like NDP-sugar epimerase
MYETLTNLPRFVKRLILTSIDIFIILLALYGAFVLRFGELYPELVLKRFWALFPISAFLGLCLMIILGLSRIKLDSFERNAILRTGLCSIGLMVICSMASYMLRLGVPRTVPIIFGILFFVGSVSSRIAGQYILDFLSNGKSIRKRVLIYGAGQAGIQLVAALRQTREVHPIAFVDDNPAVVGMIASGLPVFDARNIKDVVGTKKIDRIILAMPSASEQRRTELLRQLGKLGCEVQTLPSFLDLIEGADLVSSLKPVSADDLLGREKIDLNLKEVNRTYAGKSIMVTGAGGSIGSELCRQLVNCGISKLVLFEHSEYALYAINLELQGAAEQAGIDLVTVLGSVTQMTRVSSAITKNQVQIVLHAAAYKHVPLVETNEIVGLHNNVVGTRNVAEAALKHDVERFILISTDKAVRPTNVMGSSKRLAELVVQDLAVRSETTLFSMVRFGNVLGSSGSVIPLFHEQIANGGPVTVTHDDVTRYFMTIPEASRLVLLAGSFARGGDVFVLDMGEPVRIYDLARSMIELSGRSVRDADNPNGDIEVKVTGLRPGEKLYEELLLGDDLLTTPHAKILRAQETGLSQTEIANVLRDLMKTFEADDVVSARAVIERWVDGYEKPQISGA